MGKDRNKRVQWKAEAKERVARVRKIKTVDKMKDDIVNRRN